MELTPNAQLLLDMRYKQPGETNEQLVDRLSMGREDYRRVIDSLEFLPNSPTIFNLGTEHKGTLSACFVFYVPDTIEGIMEVATKAALVEKWGGGVGYYLGELRPKGSPISSTHRAATGPVGFLRMYNAIGKAWTQGGKRQAAQMAILPISHPDVREFIHCKDDDPQRIHTFNISVSIPDSFMELLDVEFGVDETPQNQKEACRLFMEICESAWKTGDPGIYFVDQANRYNILQKALGPLLATNPCGEVPLYDNEPCNLGSINLAKFVNEDRNDFDTARLGRTVELAVEYLDDVLDHNTFPHPDITHAAMRTRKLGLGVMGWADALALLGIRYDSDAAVRLGGRVMNFIQYRAKAASVKLLRKKGPADIGEIQNDDGWHFRNATVTCIAPTGTISLLAGCSSGIEPHYDLEWTRQLEDGTILEERVSVLEEIGDFRPHIAREIGWEWHVKHQAAFQAYTDLAVSKTINLPHEASIEDVYQAYMMMWKEGCKGGTVFRDGCREEQVLRSKGPDKALTGDATDRDMNPNGRRRLPDQRQSITHKFQVADMEGYLTVGLYEDGQPGELFIKASKEGSTIAGLLDSFAICISLALQYGVPTESLVRKLGGVRFEPAGVTQNPELPVATSIVDYAMRWLGQKFLEAPAKHEVAAGISRMWSTEDIIAQSIADHSGMLCPDCHSEAVFQEGCLYCRHCGWSRCG